ncbi:16S rRNA (cytidine(1402)-2'-O)-methyltransferase [bacterium]|nr:16S rRNA (cytidine(1402)-2'-O)-methyltransferase [bacterium]MBU1427823.1 16S rRNA (cytidine(1402)-2'-O)-methyltransferase [bacterium]MBU2439798.1 16S rRNA (cytidine(1402)-2'-O)-methyltransferase [bacterium]MBU4562548.1 16S rRNA (cytidine(1402)-2'-O)-methyltransferase [bacterium]
MDKNETEGILYICGTPIGNLEDITIRALKILKEVKLIAAEDTRHTKKLLIHYQINTKVTSYHEYNKFKKAPYLVEILKNGQDIALVSDAGMPGISDPGYVLINLALNNNIKIIPIPGVSALITALVVSGLPTDKFVFEGFLPRKIKERKRYFKSIENEERTIIFYEAPHRLKRALKDMLDVWGERKIVIARELTKKYEEIIRGNLSQVITEINTKEIKGEITLVVQGGIKKKGNDTIDFLKDECIMEIYLKKLKNQGYSNKDIIKIAQEKLNIPKNLIYKKLLEMQNK